VAQSLLQDGSVGAEDRYDREERIRRQKNFGLSLRMLVMNDQRSSITNPTAAPARGRSQESSTGTATGGPAARTFSKQSIINDLEGVREMKAQRFISGALAALLITCSFAVALAQEAAPPPQPAVIDLSVVEQSSRQARESFKVGAQPAVTQKERMTAMAGIASSTSSSTPYRTFTFGSGPNGFRYSVSAHGNVVNIESPIYANAPYRHLFGDEGYALSVATSIGTVTYWDAGSFEATGCSGTSRSWSPTVFESGVNANGTTLRRSTCDGAFELVQTFAMNPVNHELTITMTLRNFSGFNYPNTQLSRYFDGDIDRDFGDDVYSRTLDSVYGQDGGVDNLMLTALSFNTSHSTAVHTATGWNAAVATQASLATPTAAGDFVGRVTYNLGTVNNGAQRIVKALYKRS
jgi:hypothetical protein